MSAAHKIGRLYRSMGGKRTLLYLLQRQLSRWSRRAVFLRVFDLIVQPVSPVSTVPTRLIGSWTVRMVRQDEAELATTWAPVEEIRSRLARGDIGFALFQSQELVGYLWLRLGDYDEPDLRCRFAPRPKDRVAWDYDLHIMEKARGSMAFAVLWDAANALLREKGYRWTASRISAFNPVSFRAHARLGAERVGIVAFLCVGPWQLTVAKKRWSLWWHFGSHFRPSIDVVAPSDGVGMDSIDEGRKDSRSDQ